MAPTIQFLVLMMTLFRSGFGSDMVAGGGMTPYGGGGRAHGGYVRVRDPGKGFFVAGSSIREVNGLYQRTDSLPIQFHELHKYQLVYSNSITKWYMALVDGPLYEEKGYGAYGGASNEWVIIDNEGKDRFGHVGNTIIPGCGDRWGHLDSRYGKPMEPEEEVNILQNGEDIIEERSLLTSDEINEWHAKRRDELPWQMIMISGEDMLRNLQNHANHRDYRAKEATRHYQEDHMIGNGGSEGGDESSSRNSLFQQSPPLHLILRS
mmetsp:Transcript_34582/g.44587  ORF Transcript_34582/g.44587 Transcript_34582/m.44587 type:complete len:264 (+) Transcript_34582:18-809(+)